jgi:hypothetical protein
MTTLTLNELSRTERQRLGLAAEQDVVERPSVNGHSVIPSYLQPTSTPPTGCQAAARARLLASDRRRVA